MIRTDATNTVKIPIENIPIDVVMMKNQNETPAVTAMDLNLGDDASMLNRIDESH